MLDDLQNRVAQRRIGTTLRGKWVLEELIGVGGMAAVYRARHRNGARVAVKILHPTLGASEEIRRRFAHEGYVANKIDHPSVVRVLDDDSDEEGLPFFVMDLVEGETLAARVQDHYFNDEELLDVAEQACSALAAAHAAGVVHRDLKPDNLIIQPDGRVRVLDFGIARLLEDGEERSTFSTRTGIAFGTPGFTAPEQALGKRRDIGPHTDLFALGATLFYLATGDFVHEAETPQELLVLVATQPARSLRDLAPHLSPEVIAIVDRATRLAIGDRWPSANAMLDAIRAARGTVQPLLRDAETLVPPAPPRSAPVHTPPLVESNADDTFRAQMVGASMLPTRPSMARRQRRKRSALGIATAFALIGAASLVVTSTRANETRAHVAAAAVNTGDVAAIDEAPPATPSVEPLAPSVTPAATATPATPVVAKTKPAPPQNDAVKMLKALISKSSKSIDLGY